MVRVLQAIGSVALVCAVGGLLSAAYLAVRFATDLEYILFLDDSGLVPVAGTLVIVVAHPLLFGFAILHRRFERSPHPRRAYALGLCGVSVFALAVQKVMIDEVARELYLEWPMPGETVFLFVGLAVNASFLGYTLLYVGSWMSRSVTRR